MQWARRSISCDSEFHLDGSKKTKSYIVHNGKDSRAWVNFTMDIVMEVIRGIYSEPAYLPAVIIINTTKNLKRNTTLSSKSETQHTVASHQKTPKLLTIFPNQSFEQSRILKMKFYSSATTILASILVAAAILSVANASHPPPTPAPAPKGMTYEGAGVCVNQATEFHDLAGLDMPSGSIGQCDQICRANNDRNGLRGFVYTPGIGAPSIGKPDICVCLYDDTTSPADYGPCPAVFDWEGGSPGDGCYVGYTGFGPIDDITLSGYHCYSYDAFPVAEVTGDPHFRTWKNEHFEFHGQCDIVMIKVTNFANKAIDFEIHLRTKMVRYWSYVKTAAIRIGNDILEVEGSVAKENGIEKRHYHFNYEHLGPLTEIAGYPISISPRNNKYTIDLDKDYPGQKIEIKTFKEFVSVKIIGATAESFGNSTGIMGDFQTGNTYARDGNTVLNGFNELGLEWQVLPSDGKLFHEMAKPQFPELCYLPEDPRGDRARRLAESDITEEAAEKACAGLKDEFDRKGCVYDILATQDMDMVGAY